MKPQRPYGYEPGHDKLTTSTKRRASTAVQPLSTLFGVGHSDTCGGWYGEPPRRWLDDRYCTCKSEDGSTPLERARRLREAIGGSSE